MPAKFDKLGLSFQYPENWTLDEEDALAGRKSATVYSPGGGFWSVALHPPTADAEKMAEAAVDAMRQEYDDLDAEKVEQQSFAGYELFGYDLSFYCLDLISTAEVRCVDSARGPLTIFRQAEDREFERIRPVFDAITFSLLDGLKTQALGG